MYLRFTIGLLRLQRIGTLPAVADMRFLALCLLSMAGELRAEDWPQFLGPHRNGTCAATPLAAAWPKEGPPKLWQRKVGEGFSGPVIKNGRLILFHRLDNRETVECLDSKTGKEEWRVDYATAYRDDFGFDEGPRATPT